MDDGLEEQVHANIDKDRGTKRKNDPKITKSESTKKPRWDVVQQTQPIPKRSLQQPPTASSDDVGLVLSLFHRTQDLMKIIDGSAADHPQYETMAYDAEEDPDELTLEELSKLERIMTWDTDHKLDWNWWYIRLYFQDHRRYLVDRFQATLNLRGEQQGRPEETTNPSNAPNTAHNFFEEQNLHDRVAEMQLYITTLEATIGGYETAAKLAVDSSTTEVFVP